MIGALWILTFTVAVGVILYIFEIRWRRKHHVDSSHNSGSETSSESGFKSSAEVATDDAGACCGQHLVCEKQSLSPITDEIIYYDDEELDRFKDRSPESYSVEETEEFRDVLMTLLPDDVPGWARSITLRGIELPSEVRDELLMLVRENRTS